MLQYLLKRLLLILPVMFGVSLLVFLMMHFTPGDPALLMLGESASQEELHRLRGELGLLDPLPVQYVRFVAKAGQGDLGRSIRSNTPVAEELLKRMPATIELAASAMVVATVIGVLVGTISAMRPNSLTDNAATTLALAGVATPNFWMGLMLQVLFAVSLGWLPASGREGFASLILPALTLGTGTAAIVLRMTRSAMLEVIRMDFVRTARAKGVGEARVVYKHALRNALIPVITVIGLSFGNLLGGAVITESVFAWPGVGGYMVEAIRSKDLPVVQGAVLMLGLLAALVNLLVDLTYAVIDPRIRTSFSK